MTQSTPQNPPVWRGLPRLVIAQRSEETLTDAFGNSITLPRYGYLTVKEALFYSKYVYSVGEDTRMVEYKQVLAAHLIRSRFSVPDSITDEEMLKDAEGVPLPQTLIDVIYEFFMREQAANDAKRKELTGEGETEYGDPEEGGTEADPKISKPLDTTSSSDAPTTTPETPSLPGKGFGTPQTTT